MSDDDDLRGYYTVAEVAARMGWKRQTVYKYHSEGKMPPAEIKLNRPVWKHSVIDTWLANQDPEYPRPGKGWAKGRGVRR